MLSHKQKQILKQNAEILELKKREERYAYIGLLSEYQLHPPSLIQSLDYTKLNPYQHFLFKRVLHGLNMYKKDEIENMHWDKKRRIKRVWRKGQEALNEFKQYICYKNANKIFSIFNHSPLAQHFIDTPFEYVPSIRNKMTLKDVDLTYEDVIIKFMQKGLLPKNFLSLKPNEYKKSFKEDGSQKQRVQQVKKEVLAKQPNL